MSYNIAQIVIKNKDADNYNNARRYWYSEKPITLDAVNTEKFYETYRGLFDTQFWDVRINSNSMYDETSGIGLQCVRNIVVSDEEASDPAYQGDPNKLGTTFQMETDGAYYISFEVVQSKYYDQSFKLIARTTDDYSEGATSITVQSYVVPAGVGSIKLDAVFVPSQKTLNNTDVFKSLIFQMERGDSYNPSMDLKNLYIYEMKNLLPTTDDDYQSNPTLAAAASIETTAAGECVLIINDSKFYIGNDKMLNIDEEMNVEISNINFLQFLPIDSIDINNTTDFVVCLINYKY